MAKTCKNALWQKQSLKVIDRRTGYHAHHHPEGCHQMWLAGKSRHGGFELGNRQTGIFVNAMFDDTGGYLLPVASKNWRLTPQSMGKGRLC